MHGGLTKSKKFAFLLMYRRLDLKSVDSTIDITSTILLIQFLWKAFIPKNTRLLVLNVSQR